MRNQTKSLNKLLLSKVKIATVNEQQMIVGGDRKKRGTNSKTGDTRHQIQGGQLIGHVQDEFVFM
ncbi:hypothetical protein KORDIASMS9_04530 [Kordia sp. SMS9]|uniref:hypothetical protein n=1 Tax=Kordia sp. SMS9 TaxID=2282170 RepID=UPI000E0D052C|nr:hypothetical protein [Kordia sp. SMS9]AXG72261.1 hypothetical protein KORDIASMS9_04530 [Kordia sp. SMS9]